MATMASRRTRRSTHPSRRRASMAGTMSSGVKRSSAAQRKRNWKNPRRSTVAAGAAR